MADEANREKRPHMALARTLAGSVLQSFRKPPIWRGIIELPAASLRGGRPIESDSACRVQTC